MQTASSSLSFDTPFPSRWTTAAFAKAWSTEVLFAPILRHWSIVRTRNFVSGPRACLRRLIPSSCFLDTDLAPCCPEITTSFSCTLRARSGLVLPNRPWEDLNLAATSPRSPSSLYEFRSTCLVTLQTWQTMLATEAPPNPNLTVLYSGPRDPNRSSTESTSSSGEWWATKRNKF